MRAVPQTPVLMLSRRWLVSAGARRSGVLIGVTFSLLAVVVVGVSGFTPTPAQQARSALGSYARSTYDSVIVGDLESNSLPKTQAALDTAAPGSHLRIFSTDLRPDSFAKTFVQAPIAPVTFVQDPTLRTTYLGRYTLDAGSWPESPRDVVVSERLRARLPDPDRFTVLSGRVTLHVMGTVTDADDRHGDVIVAAPGTWESIRPAAPGHEYQPTTAQLMVLFQDATSLPAIGRALSSILPPRPPSQGTVSEALTNNISTRIELLAQPTAGFGSRDNLVVSYLPLLLIVLVVTALAVVLTRRDQAANTERLLALGVRRRLIAGSQMIAMAIVAGLATVIGLAVGWLVVIVARPVVLQRLADQPLSPVAAPSAQLLVIAASGVIMSTLGMLTVRPRRRQHAAGQALPQIRRRLDILALVRRGVVLALGIATVTLADPSGATYLTVAAALLLAPDLLRIGIRLLPEADPRLLLVRRLNEANRARQASAVVVVAACVALPACIATQLATRKAADFALSYNRVPAHQIWVQRNGDTGDIAAVARVVSSVNGAGDPVPVRELTSTSAHGVTSAYFTTHPTGNHGLSTIVVGDYDQLQRMLGTALPSAAHTTLDRGGVLDFTGVAGSQRFTVTAPNGDQVMTGELPTLKVPLDRVLTVQFSGAVLLSTARALHLPVSVPLHYIYPDVSTSVTARAVATTVDSGYDSKFVQYDVTPPQPDLPTAAYLFLVALVLGSAGVLLLVVVGIAHQLRAYSTRLVAIGLTPRWLTTVFGVQSASVVGLGLLAGAVAGVSGVFSTASSHDVLVVPILPIAAAVAGTVLATGLALVIAFRSLTASQFVEVT